MTKTESTCSSKKPTDSHDEEALQEVASPPWTAEQVQAWRQSQPVISVWRVLVLQMLVAGLIAMVLAVWFRSSALWLSWMYGAVTVVFPAALFARGLTSRAASLNAMTAAMSFAAWQGVKWVLAVLLLVLAPRMLPELSWPALLAGLIVTMKVYWLALIWGKPKSTPHLNTTL